MVRFFSTFLGAVTIFMASPVSACMADGPDGYSTGLIWQNEATEIPVGALSIFVRLERPIPGTWMGFVAKVLEGPPKMEGQEIDVMPQNLTSCVGLGVIEGFMVVRAEPIKTNTDSGPRIFYEAIDYRPSKENERQRRDGGEQWLYPGEPAPNVESPL